MLSAKAVAAFNDKTIPAINISFLFPFKIRSLFAG